jgi:hypothetical protein
MLDGANGIRPETERLPAETLPPEANGAPDWTTENTTTSPGVKPEAVIVVGCPTATLASETTMLSPGAG